MMYVITYTRNSKVERHVGTRSQVQALADYLSRTFRIESTIVTQSKVGADR